MLCETAIVFADCADDHVRAGSTIQFVCVELAVILPADNDPLGVDVDGRCFVYGRGQSGWHIPPGNYHSIYRLHRFSKIGVILKCQS